LTFLLLTPFSVTMTIRLPYQDEALKDDGVLDIEESSDEDNGDDDDEEILAAGTEVSASEFAGDLAQAPTKMFFGARECGAIFTLPLDQGLFIRVCGCSASSCNRRGHSTLIITEEGCAENG
jgi:hypothetical protein